MLSRKRHIAHIRSLLTSFPVVGIIGARQVGKTTLAQMVSATEPSVELFDLESPADRARLGDPLLALERLEGLVILDEIQLVPDLFPLLRVLADRPGPPARFLVLGSVSPDLLRQGSESLAGRIAWHVLTPFALDETGAERLDDLWLRGGFPRSFLAGSEEESAQWRRSFIDTLLNRDLPQLGIGIPAVTLRRFWTMLAHYHGQTWNSSEFARSLGVSDKTVRRYLDLLTQAFVLRQLPPWHENVAKRQVRAPRVYLADCGLLHALLDLESMRSLQSHPKLGASWEGFCLANTIEHLGARPDQCFYWRTHGGAELDLLVRSGTRHLGFEFKRTSTPRVTRSMRIVQQDLALEQLWVIHAGRHSFPLAQSIHAVAANRLLLDIEPLRAQRWVMNRRFTRIGRMTEERSDAFVPGSPSSRLSLVWPLTQEVTSLSRHHDVERRLQRHVAVVTRRTR